MSQPAESERVPYTYKATERFWKNFYALGADQKESTRKAWQVFKEDPFDPSLGTHKIHALTAKAGTTVYGVVIEGDLRVVFLIDGQTVVSLDIGTHAVYGRGIPKR